MAKEYVVGDHWLAKRRDGKAVNVWQIARYAPQSRSVVYRSTRCSELDDAKAAIHAYVDQVRAKRPQTAEQAIIAPHLFNYWNEYANTLVNAENAAQAIRMFLAFLDQDEVGVTATFVQATPQLFERFRLWRMQPHSWSVPWQGRTFNGSSEGVSGETVQRNLNNIRAALNHAASNGRVPYVPKVPSINARHRTQPREVVLSMEQLGAIYGYARDDKPLWQWLCLMLATAARPVACLAFDPATQDKGALLDMHPPALPRTNKRNPIVPCIAPLRPILDHWKLSPVGSRKRAWRTLRRALELPAYIYPKAIRHTVATLCLHRGVPNDEISHLLAHSTMHRTTAVYAKYSPAYLDNAKAALTTIFNDVMAAADLWDADHCRSTKGQGGKIVIDLKGKKLNNL